MRVSATAILVIAMILMTIMTIIDTVTTTAIRRHNPSDLQSPQLWFPYLLTALFAIEKHVLKGAWLQARRGCEVWGLGNYLGWQFGLGSAGQGSAGQVPTVSQAALPPGVGWLLVGAIWQHGCVSLSTQQAGLCLSAPRRGRLPRAASGRALMQKHFARFCWCRVYKCLHGQSKFHGACWCEGWRRWLHVLMGEVGHQCKGTHIQGGRKDGWPLLQSTTGAKGWHLGI